MRLLQQMGYNRTLGEWSRSVWPAIDRQPSTWFFMDLMNA